MASKAGAKAGSKPTTYFSNGQTLSSPPLSVRLRGFYDNAVAFGGLYLTSLFTLDAYTAASQSPYSLQNRYASHTGNGRGPSGSGSSWGSGRGGGPGGPGGPGGAGGSGGRKIGRVDDIRGPECGSCG